MAEKKTKKRKGVKNVRQTKRRHARNLTEKNKLRRVMKDARKALTSKAEQTIDQIKAAVSALDKASEKKIIHANKAGRLKSRLMKAFNKLTAGAA
jgi:small subunit ribosomal protein S20